MVPAVGISSDHSNLREYNKGSIEDNIAEAYKEAQAATAILYDSLTNSYYPNSNFNFATAFNDKTSTLNFYPTFVAIVQEYNVTFYDGLNNNNNGYGGMAYYSSETCGYVNNSWIKTDCILRRKSVCLLRSPSLQRRPCWMAASWRTMKNML